MPLTTAKSAFDAGVNSGMVLALLKKFEELGGNNHSIIVYHNGQIAVEGYTAPYAAEYAHSMFSVSKSFTMTAIGFAIAEGLLTLDTPILDVFPEYAEYAKDKRFEDITIQRLLTMSSGKKCNFVKNMAKGDYAKDFLTSKFEKEVKFVYSNDDVYMLAKAVVKVTGQSVLDYLQPRLLTPLGIDKPFWETTVQGIEAAATGLYLTSRDLLKVTICYMQMGMYEGVQVIPREWVEAASIYRVKLPDYYGSTRDYGYLVWGDPHGGYRFDGMFGQFGIVFPRHNAVVVMTNGGNCELYITEEVWKCFPKAFEDVGDGSADRELAEYLSARSTMDIPITPRNTAAEQLTVGKRYAISDFRAKLVAAFGYPISMIPWPVNVAFPRKPWRSMDGFEFDFGGTQLKICWTEDTDRNEMRVGLNGEFARSDITLATLPFKMLCAGHWVGDELILDIYPIETAIKRSMILSFRGNRLCMKLDSTPSFEGFTLGHMGEVVKPPKSKILRKLLYGTLHLFLSATRPNLHGRARKKRPV